MTDAAIENAAAIRNEMAEKIAAAEVQIKEWRAKMARAERFIADWEEFSGHRAPGTGADTGFEPVSRMAAGGKPKNPKKEEVAAVARQILIDNGRPMSRDDLFAALVERGVEIFGQDPRVVLQTMLWRMSGEIVHLKGFGYWAADQAYAPAGHNPTAMAELNSELASSISL